LSCFLQGNQHSLKMVIRSAPPEIPSIDHPTRTGVDKVVEHYRHVIRVLLSRTFHTELDKEWKLNFYREHFQTQEPQTNHTVAIHFALPLDCVRRVTTDFNADLPETLKLWSEWKVDCVESVRIAADLRRSGGVNPKYLVVARAMRVPCMVSGAGLYLRSLFLTSRAGPASGACAAGGCGGDPVPAGR